MSKLITIYPQAIEHTKIKVYQDIDHYLETKDALPNFQQYLTDRSHYLEQLWINVWLNKSTNDIPKNEKKQFLSKRDFEVQGVDRKLINKLFRDEMRSYQPFDTLAWVIETFEGKNEKWTQRYGQAKENYIKREEQKQLEEKKRAFREEIVEATTRFVEEQYDLIYIYLRHFAARKLAADLRNNVKFQSVAPRALEEKLTEEGEFKPSDYKKVRDFFDELTGDIQKTLDWGRHYFEYETYYYVYESLIFDFLSDFVPKKVLEIFSADFKTGFFETIHEKLSDSFIRKTVGELLYDAVGSCLEDIEEEYLSDLLKLAEIPFDEEIHRQIFEQDMEEHERRNAGEQAELLRKKEEEARIMWDIFGEEYDPTLRRNVRYVLHIGDTNTGKTYHALEKMKAAASGLYLGRLGCLPLKCMTS